MKIASLQVVLVLCFLGACLAAEVVAGVTTGLGFKAGVNVTASVTDNGWQYRKVYAKAFDTVLGEGFNYESVSVGKTGNSINGDILVATAYIKLNGYPIAFAGFFADSLQWTTDITNDFTSVTSAFAAAAGYLGVAFIELYETTPSGSVVAGQSLKSAMIADKDGLTYSITDHSNATATLKYITFTGTNGGFSISFTFVASSVAGILNQSNIAVGPKSVECIVSIDNWNYANSNNSLNLLVGVATGGAKVAASGRTLYSVNGTNQIFFSTGNVSTDDSGNSHAVSVAILSNSTVNIPDTNFANQVSAKYGAKAAYYITKVTFPAGAETIVYDPSLGEGTPVDDSSASTENTSAGSGSEATTSSASTVVISLAAMFMVAVVCAL